MTKMIRMMLFTSASVLLPAWDATAAALGPALDIPVEWVWVRVPPSGVFRRIGSMHDIAAASNGTNFLVVWSQRGMSPGVAPDGEEPRTSRAGVFGIRIDAAGKVLDATPIKLTLERVTGSQHLVGRWLAYAASSDSYLAAWPCDNNTCAARVDSSGTLLDASPILLPPGGLPIVASDGRSHSVLVSSQMFVINGDGTWMAYPIAFQVGSVASGGTHLLNVTHQPNQVTLFDVDGTTLSSTAMPFQALIQPSVGFDGNEYLILWEGFGPDGRGEYVTRVGLDGVPRDTSARIRLSGGGDNSFDISFDGVNAVGAWCSVCVHDTNPATIAVLRVDGEIVTAGFLSAGPILHTLSVASNSANISLVVVDGFRYGPGSTPSFFPVAQLIKTPLP